ncbi:unnamed protein product [Didymodactylos carnosus]|uniref:Uncharacterized protein n=1 Tax=Didymodactylos carnosus TaxID=1234261 RepID=A0A8S2DNG9_9BILA|nr:unnamed protein product [Didymodactylos carnosus]CAF3784858.1 unnamed protein product [Didymodactylos carnosus]
MATSKVFIGHPSFNRSIESHGSAHSTHSDTTYNAPYGPSSTNEDIGTQTEIKTVNELRRRREETIVDISLESMKYNGAIPFRQLQRPDRLNRQNSRQSECDGSVLGVSDLMSNNQNTTTNIVHGSGKSNEQQTMNVTASTLSPPNGNNNSNNGHDMGGGGGGGGGGPPRSGGASALFITDDSRPLVNTMQPKRAERTSRKECYRLGRRKLLFEKRRKASDYALFFAMVGLLFMVLEQELSMARIYNKKMAFHLSVPSPSLEI